MRMAPSTFSTLALFLSLIFNNFQHSSSFSLSVENLEKDVIISSPKGTFTAGFYPVGHNAYCFAIWYTQQQPYNKHKNNPTIVWMANRDQPVNGKRSKLYLVKTGNLVLTDAGKFDIWSTNTVSSSKQLHLRLYDTGNLVLQDNNINNNNTSSVLWQSFDSPTDTLLPGQRLTGNTILLSSRNSNDYSSGFYKLFFDYENVLRLFYVDPRVSNDYWPVPWLRSNNFGSDNGRSTYNNTRVLVMDQLGYLVSSDNFTFSTSDYGMVLQRRLTLDHDGNVRVYSRKDEQEEWSISGQFIQQSCTIHGICGPNSICSFDMRVGKKCSCVPGYSWIDDQDWSQGCKPNFQLWCNKIYDNSRFLRLQGVDFYGYDYGAYTNITFEECMSLCLKLCQCKGFQYAFSVEDGVFHCYPKTQLLNGGLGPDLMRSIYLRLPENSPSSYDYENPIRNNNGLVCLGNSTGVKELERSYVKAKENRSVEFLLWFASAFGAVEMVCIFLVWCFLVRNSRKLHFGSEKQGYVLAAATGFRKFSYSELKQATKGFSHEIGKGAGGIVYKGVLFDNRVAAIKQLHDVANQGETEFLAEVSILGRLNHMNLIEMWGYCAEGKHRLLVYEYMENGSLAENLSSNSKALDWVKRYDIALGTAKGLAYLHEECLEWILHCDIKPQNILLDSDYQPKVADFGLSKLLNRNNLNDSSFSRIRGTRGYMAPEWVFNLPITSKVDVYSYGIVVLEMITGRSPTAGIQVTKLGAQANHHERLVKWVREKRRKGSEGASSWVDQIVDPALGSNYDMNKMEILANVALECVKEEKDERPSMSQVAERLQSLEHDS